jgi:hypothetical protein
MKYIKIYENLSNNIILHDKYCWVIYGNTKTILNVYEKLENQSPQLHTTSLTNTLKSTAYKGAIGIYLFYDNINNFNGIKNHLLSYWIFINKNRQDKAKEYIMYNYLFQGELKLLDNKLILDPMEANVNKYNI